MILHKIPPIRFASNLTESVGETPQVLDYELTESECSPNKKGHRPKPMPLKHVVADPATSDAYTSKLSYFPLPRMGYLDAIGRVMSIFGSSDPIGKAWSADWV